MSGNDADPNVPFYGYFLDGQWLTDTPSYQVRSPYSGNPVASVHRAGPAELERAISAAVAAFEATRKLPAHERATILRAISDGITARSDELARSIAEEAGKPIKQARVEVGRSAFTFAQAAEEATRIHGELLNLDAHPNGAGRQGIVRRFPIGPIAAITPFNFPINLVSHKLAPAIAAGCPVVLKPASQTPITALKLAEIIAAASWPAGALAVLPMQSADAAPLVEDERIKLLTFTGSPAVGWELKGRAGRKRVTLELGGNAGVIVHRDADLPLAASRCVMGGFSYAGQTCISVQRIFVHEESYESFMDAFVPAVQALKLGDPLDEDSDLSALISLGDAQRVETWLAEARAAGAEVLLGGGVRDALVEPTIVVKAGPELRINCQEVFAPVVTVQTYAEFEQALAAVNGSDYGLQAGVFTNDLKLAWRAFEALEVGGVIVNDVPTWRVDHMPYGGVKQSGFGREGLRYAIEEMTEMRLLALNLGSDTHR
jgi:glyceraldehyde-3-phosphate dehydrogenase (NADP+)